MTTELPSVSSMLDVGSVFLTEFSFEDGCNHVRVHPLVILEKPKRTLIPNLDCVTPQLQYIEWSDSVQFFRDSPGEASCLDHTIAIRITLSSGTDVSVVLDNVSSLLSQFASANMPYTLSPP